MLAMIYVYGPAETSIEQISSGGTVTYLHHDQAGSTRLLTGPTGTVTGKCTYSAYGTPTCEGSTTTPVGYDAQYTSTDTGLIYMRARTYDPATAQFLSVDPMASVTRTPYAYAGDNPLDVADATGMEASASTPCGRAANPGEPFGPQPGGKEPLNPSEPVGEAVKTQGEEMEKHHCHNNQVVINHHCTSTPPEPKEYPPPEHPLEEGWPVIPIIPIPVPIPIPIPD
jgi:RHS repeat-associated protein